MHTPIARRPRPDLPLRGSVANLVAGYEGKELRPVPPSPTASMRSSVASTPVNSNIASPPESVASSLEPGDLYSVCVAPAVGPPPNIYSVTVRNNLSARKWSLERRRPSFEALRDELWGRRITLDGADVLPQGYDVLDLRQPLAADRDEEAQHLESWSAAVLRSPAAVELPAVMAFFYLDFPTSSMYTSVAAGLAEAQRAVVRLQATARGHLSRASPTGPTTPPKQRPTRDDDEVASAAVVTKPKTKTAARSLFAPITDEEKQAAFPWLLLAIVLLFFVAFFIGPSALIGAFTRQRQQASTLSQAADTRPMHVPPIGGHFSGVSMKPLLKLRLPSMSLPTNIRLPQLPALSLPPRENVTAALAAAVNRLPTEKLQAIMKRVFSKRTLQDMVISAFAATILARLQPWKIFVAFASREKLFWVGKAAAKASTAATATAAMPASEMTLVANTFSKSGGGGLQMASIGASLAKRARNWGVAIGGSKLVRAFWGKAFQPVPPPPPYSVLSLGVGSWMPQGAVGKTVVAFASLVFAALL